MRRLLLFSMVALLLVPAAASARAKSSGGVPLPPGAAKSDNLEYLGSFGEQGARRGQVRPRARVAHVLITTGRFGFRIYDVSDPRAARSSWTSSSRADPDAIHRDRKRATGRTRTWTSTRAASSSSARSTRGTTTPQEWAAGTEQGTLGTKNRDPDCRSGFFVISYGNPHNLRQVGDFVELPAGHTASCINDCDYVWTGGPARRDDLAYLGPFTPGGRGDGRPIWVTDLRNARKPKVFGNPIDLWRNDQVTDYSHDVQVDERASPG